MTQAASKHSTRTPAEWITFGIAALILAGLVGSVLYMWATDRERPPVLTLKSSSPMREAKGQFYVPFELTNEGGETVESVQIVAELKRGDRVEETGEQQIDFLSGGETEEGAFIFRQNPQQGELVLRVSGYTVP